MKILLGFLVVAAIIGLVYFLSRSKPEETETPDRKEQVPAAETFGLRRTVLEREYGPAEASIATAVPPFYLGGGADVLTFRQRGPGVAYATCSLIGDEHSRPNELGQYELMIRLHEGAEWAPNLISQLARYTAEAVLAPNDTMDVGPALPQPTALTAFLFLTDARVTVDGRKGSVMLCLGITSDELEYIQTHDVEDLMAKLRERSVYPFTDLARKSVLADPDVKVSPP